MIDTDKLHKLSQEFDPASWAVWSKEFPEEGSPEERVWNGDESDAIYNMILENSDKLRSQVILLGINPSDGLEGDYSNFHHPGGGKNDRYLKQTIQDQKLERIYGAYMTDLLKDEDSTEAHEAGDLSDKHIKKFNRELSRLDRQSYDVICFGKSKFEQLFPGPLEGQVEKIDEVSPSILRMQTDSLAKPVTFYLVYHYIRTHKEGMEKQLRYLNEEVLN